MRQFPKQHGKSWSAHFIRAVVLDDLVWMHMKAIIFYVTRYEKNFRAVMEQKLRLSGEEKICTSVKRRQNIRISYDLVGFIPLNELVKAETA